MRTSKAIFTAVLLASMSAAAQQAAESQPSQQASPATEQPAAGTDLAGGAGGSDCTTARCAHSNHDGSGGEPLH